MRELDSDLAHLRLLFLRHPFFCSSSALETNFPANFVEQCAVVPVPCLLLQNPDHEACMQPGVRATLVFWLVDCVANAFFALR